MKRPRVDPGRPKVMVAVRFDPAPMVMRATLRFPVVPTLGRMQVTLAMAPMAADPRGVAAVKTATAALRRDPTSIRTVGSPYPEPETVGSRVVAKVAGSADNKSELRC